MKRHYRQVPMMGGGVQFQVITAIGHHWRHIAVVNVKDGEVSRAERYFYSTRAPEVILPFEVMGRDFIVMACREMQGIQKARNLTLDTLAILKREAVHV
jgi:hypothetical protein